jgi:hypothetical protein
VTDSAENPEEITREGPDPREWESGAIGRLVADIEAILRVQVVRKAGSSVYGNAHDETARLLDRLMDAAQDQLAMKILTAYGVPVPESGGEPAFPFSGAGKTRAFGAAPQEPARQ